MSTLHAFLHPASAEDILEVEVSKRFRDENGKAVPFKIRAVTQEENDLLVKRSMRPVKGGRRGEKELDGSLLSPRIVVAATVEPDFTSEELCRAYGVLDPLEVPGKMLLAGEFKKLSEEIMRLSGFDDAEDLEEEAKN